MNTKKTSRASTYLPLLKDAQEYLQLLLEDRAPNSVLALAWNDFYRVYDDLIRRFVSAQGVATSDVDDCVQEVWSEVVTRLARFDRRPDRPGLRSWLYKLVRSKSADVYRSRQRQPTAGMDEALAQAADGRQPDVMAQWEMRWQVALVETVIGELESKMSATSFRVLEMRLKEGRDVTEVAETLQLPPAQVRYRYHRAKKKLRTQLTMLTGQPPDSLRYRPRRASSTSDPMTSA